MTALRTVLLVLTLLSLVGCAGPPPATPPRAAPDIIGPSFPEAQAAVLAAVLAINEHVSEQDLDGLESDDLDSPKFSKFGPRVMQRQGFDGMIADERAAVSAARDLSIEFRELQIDVFGEVAIATSYPLFSSTGPDGEPVEREARMTLVYAKTSDGWKIVHEHSSPYRNGAR